MKLGIEILKILFVSILQFGTKAAESLKDGAQVRDLWTLAEQWPNLNTILQQATAGWAEFKDLDPLESAELVEFLAAKFDIANDQVEARIESGLRLAAKWHHQVGSTVILFEETQDFVKSLKAA